MIKCKLAATAAPAPAREFPSLAVLLRENEGPRTWINYGQKEMMQQRTEGQCNDLTIREASYTNDEEICGANNV